MKHNPKRAKWTKAYRRAAGKEMQLDSTFDFEKKRNTPVKYDRNLMIKTIKAMQVVDRIKKVRKERFHKQRLAAQIRKRTTSAQKEIAKGKDLLEGPAQDKAVQYAKHFAEEKQKKLEKAKSKVRVDKKSGGGAMEVEG
jgi:large subunit ribosomal protein L24e